MTAIKCSKDGPWRVEHPKQPRRLLVGVDLGQAQDHTAICVIESTAGGYLVSHLERLPVGTRYPDVVTKLRSLLSHPILRKGITTTIIDATGVGAPVIDYVRREGIRCVGVSITAGVQPGQTRPNDDLTAPKRDLIQNLVVLAETGRLKISKNLELADILAKELQGLEVKISAAGNDSYGCWRDGQHDDLVLSLALALWYEERGPRPPVKTRFFAHGPPRRRR